MLPEVTNTHSSSFSAILAEARLSLASCPNGCAHRRQRRQRCPRAARGFWALVGLAHGLEELLLIFKDNTIHQDVGNTWMWRRFLRHLLHSGIARRSCRAAQCLLWGTTALGHLRHLFVAGVAVAQRAIIEGLLDALRDGPGTCGVAYFDAGLNPIGEALRRAVLAMDHSGPVTVGQSRVASQSAMLKVAVSHRAVVPTGTRSAATCTAGKFQYPGFVGHGQCLRVQVPHRTLS